MSLEVFTGQNVPALLARARESLGPDACVLQVRRCPTGFELIAADRDGTPLPRAARPDFSSIGEALVQVPRGPKPKFDFLMSSSAAVAAAPEQPPVKRPRIIALVGPTGAGKTTTIAKLAVHPAAFGVKTVGLLGLDTYRVGAVEQLSTYAELAGLPIEVAYAANDLERALERLDNCDVVLVDTPGRGPRQFDDTRVVREWLTLIAPQEVHLVLPAGRMPMVTRRTIETFAPFGITHVLATKVDECPDDERLFDVAVERGLPIRWLTDGQEVPTDLHDAAERYSASQVRVATQRARAGAAA